MRRINRETPMMRCMKYARLLTIRHFIRLRTALMALAALIAIGIDMAAAETGQFGFVLYKVSDSDFNAPEALVLSARGTHLYVTDAGHNIIRVVQPFALQTISTISHKSLKSPRGITLGEDLLLYVADSGNARIISYSVAHDSADPVRTYQKDLDRPTGIAQWRDKLYIVNQSDDSIVVRDASGNSRKLKKSGSAPGEFDNPIDIIVAPEGHIIVSDRDNDRIQILSQALEPIKILKGEPYKFDEPTHMALDERGNLFIADTDNHRILVLDDDFNIVGQIGTGRRGKDAGRLDSPKGVAARNGYVWVSDTGNNRILLYQYAARIR